MSESNSENALVLDEHIPRSSKIAYAVANTGNGLLSGLGINQIVVFYTTKLGMNPELQGIVWLIFAIWNAVNDPLIGILEEKTQSKLGRRIPYLRYGSILYAILFVLVWVPFAKPGDQVALFFNLLIVLFVFDTVYSMIGLVTYSLPAEMCITSQQRSSIMIYSTFIGLVSQIAGYALPVLFLTATHSIREWQILMIFVGIIGGACLYFGSYYIKENEWARKEETLGFIESIKETFKNTQFLILEISIFALLISQTVLMSGLVFLINYVVEYESFSEFLYLIPAVIILVSAIFGFTKLVPKLGLKKTFIIGTIIGAVGFGILPLMGRTLNTLWIPISLIVVGIASLIMGQQPLMADVIDYDEVLTKKRRETTYSGINALITKPAISIANWLFLLILARYGYDENLDAAAQPSTVGDGVILAFSVIPVICIIVSAIGLYFYKLDGPAWVKKKLELHNIHVEKEKSYVEELKKEGILK